MFPMQPLLANFQGDWKKLITGNFVLIVIVEKQSTLQRNITCTNASEVHIKWMGLVLI